MNLRTLVSAGMLVTAGMVASRVLGFLREAMIAANYGTGADANMVIGLLLIPDYITSILIGGALSAVLLPAFASRDEAGRLALFWQVMLLSVIVFTVLALLVYSQADPIIMAVHGDASQVPNTALFWALFSMPFAGASGVITAWLQYHSRFTIPAFANALFNFVIVLTLWLAPSGFTVLGLGIFTAGLVRLALFATGFARTSAAQLPTHQPWQIDKRMLAHYAAAVGNSFFSLLPQYIPYLIITLLAGQMALFNYAFKLVLLPGMIFSTIINVVLLPRFVHLRKEGRDVPEYGHSLRMITALALCIALTMGLASWHIVMLCFGYGAMTEADIAEVAHIFSIGIWSLPGMLAGYLWQQAFFVCERPGVPFKVGMAQALVSVPLVWLAEQYYTEAGVMGAYIILQLLPVVAFSFVAHRHNLVPLQEQWKDSLAMLLVPVILFIPLAALFGGFELSPVSGVIMAVVIGAVLLLASYACNSDIRQWTISTVKQYRK